MTIEVSNPNASSSQLSASSDPCSRRQMRPGGGSRVVHDVSCRAHGDGLPTRWSAVRPLSRAVTARVGSKSGRGLVSWLMTRPSISARRWWTSRAGSDDPSSVSSGTIQTPISSWRWVISERRAGWLVASTKIVRRAWLSTRPSSVSSSRSRPIAPGDGFDGGGADVDGQPGPHRGLSLEDASEHPDEEGFAGPEAVRGRPDREAGGGVDGAVGELAHAARSQDVDGGIEQLAFTVQHHLDTTSVVNGTTSVVGCGHGRDPGLPVLRLVHADGGDAAAPPATAGGDQLDLQRGPQRGAVPVPVHRHRVQPADPPRRGSRSAGRGSHSPWPR